MNLPKIVRYQFQKLKSRINPTERQKNVTRWLLCDGEKFRYSYDLNSNSLVFDVGGFKGQWASDIYSMYNCNIIIIEPQLDFYYKIKERFKNNSKIEVHPIALGASNREELISFDDDASSTFNNSISKKEIMKFEDVFEFFEKNNIQNVDLAKINIEGGEYELLDRIIETGLVKKIKNFQIQFHDFVPNAKSEMERIQSKLNLTHQITYQFPFVWENWKIK